MATLLSVDEVRQHIETDLADPALTRLVEDADAEIIARLGDIATATETADGTGHDLFPLNRKCSAVSSVVMRIGQTDYPLGADDYAIVRDGRWLQRRSGSVVPELVWHGIITVVYTPADDTASRKRLLVNLVMLSVQYDGTKTQNIGDANATQFDYMQERENLFAPFMRKGRRFII